MSHRKYATRGKLSSIQKCCDWATEVVTQFLDMHKEFEPGGQLETERWYMSSITWHDFLLGCMALCLTICSTMQYSVDPANASIVKVVESLTLLEKARDVCEKQSHRGKDTKRVRRLIEATIRKCGVEDNESALATQNGHYATSTRQLNATQSALNSNECMWSESMLSPTDTG